MKAEQIIVPLAAFIIGGALGVALAPMPTAEPQKPVEKRVEKGVKLELEDQSAAVLRAQVQELKKQIAALKAEKEDASAQAEVQVAEEARPERERRGGGRDGWRERMERMKKENPEQYAAMTNGIARWRRSRLEAAQNKLDFFGSIDMSKMSDEDRERTEKLQDLLVKREELESKMSPESDATDDERRQMMRDMWSMGGEINQLNGQVREALFRQTVAELGFVGEEADAVSGAISAIIEMTSDGGMGGPGGPGGGRGGPGGGRGRRR